MQKPMRGKTPLAYSEILRVVGQYIERSHLSQIRVLETEEGLILQGLCMDGPKMGERMTYEVTADDIADLLEDSFAQRGREIPS